MHNRRPVIGITSSKDDENRRIFIHHAYMEMVEKAGAIPVLLPMTDDESMLDDMIELCDGFILSGGGDMDSAWWGEELHKLAGGINPMRDRMEVALTRKLYERNVPTLGICRGVQVMNVALGGTLVQDIPSQVEQPIIHRDVPNQYEESHEVEVAEGTLLAAIIGCGRVGVNTLHHQAVRDVAPGFTVAAKSPDGVFEAIENREKRFFLGVQWHPERLGMKNKAAAALFAYFCKMCQKA